MRSWIATVIVLVVGFSLLWWGTDGFHAYTAEGARRLAVLEQPEQVLPTVMEDQSGQKLTFDDYKGKYLLMTFIYTRCGDVCPALEKSFQEVYEGLPKDRLGSDISMLTVSFDRANDDVHALHHYSASFGADGQAWKMARVPDEKELERLLKQFGVVVIPNKTGGFEHNAAIYLIDREGKLAKIFDFDDSSKVLDYVNRNL